MTTATPACPAIPLERAMICAELECSTIVEWPTAACPRCGESSLMPLARWLGRHKEKA